MTNEIRALIKLLSFLFVGAISLFSYQVGASSLATPLVKPTCKDGITHELMAEEVTAYNRFTVELFKQVAAGVPDKNVVISPAMVSLLLSMVYEGADNLTRAKMDEMLPFKSVGEHRQGTQAFIQNIQSQAVLSIGSAAWVDNGFDINPEYQSVLEDCYLSGLHQVDFKQPLDAAEVINGWASQATNDMIQELVSAESIDPVYTKLILTNALHFKDKWETAFESTKTNPRGHFMLRENTTVTVPMMTQFGVSYMAHKDEQLGMTAVSLPFNGDVYEMVFWVPDRVEGLQSLEKVLDYETFDVRNAPEYRESWREYKVLLELPRLKMLSNMDLGPVLESMGLTRIFEEQLGQFARIAFRTPLKVSSIVQKSALELDEKGVEAAAASAVMFNTFVSAGEEELLLSIDRPSLFFIQDKATGLVLFIGRLQDPSQQ